MLLKVTKLEDYVRYGNAFQFLTYAYRKTDFVLIMWYNEKLKSSYKSSLTTFMVVKKSSYNYLVGS